jgi:hypothetical protein
MFFLTLSARTAVYSLGKGCMIVVVVGGLVCVGDTQGQRGKGWYREGCNTLDYAWPKSDKKCPENVQSRRPGLDKKRREVRMQRKCRGVRVCWGNLLKGQRGYASHRNTKNYGCKACKTTEKKEFEDAGEEIARVRTRQLTIVML